MRNDNQNTPREEAYSIALGWLQNVYNEVTADLDDSSEHEGFKHETKAQVAKLHNRLLKASGLDGIELNELKGRATEVFKEFNELLDSQVRDDNHEGNNEDH